MSDRRVQKRKRSAPIQERSPTARYLLLTQILIEKHGCIGNWPGKVDVFSQSLRCRDAVLQGALVEHVRWKFR